MNPFEMRRRFYLENLFQKRCVSGANDYMIAVFEKSRIFRKGNGRRGGRERKRMDGDIDRVQCLFDLLLLVLKFHNCRNSFHFCKWGSREDRAIDAGDHGDESSSDMVGSAVH